MNIQIDSGNKNKSNSQIYKLQMHMYELKGIHYQNILFKNLILKMKKFVKVQGRHECKEQIHGHS